VFFYEARPVKLKICLIGSTFYPSFRQAFSLFAAVSFNLYDNAYSLWRALTPISQTKLLSCQSNTNFKPTFMPNNASISKNIF
jgi:hypothetical protein